MPTAENTYDNNLNYGSALGDAFGNDEQGSAGKLKEEKNKARSLSSGMQKLGANMYQKGKKQEGEGKTGGAFLTGSGRMMNRGGKILGAKEKGRKAMDKVKDLPGKTSRFASGRMLQWAWPITFSVYGFIPGLLYLNLHAFGRLVMPDMLCPFGEEWTGGMLKKVGTGGKLMNYGMKLGEKGLLLLLNIIFAIVLLLLVLIIYFILHPISSKVEVIKLFLGDLGSSPQP